MKELFGKCKNCLGCNLLEQEDFNGKYRCDNYISCETQEKKNENIWDLRK